MSQSDYMYIGDGDGITRLHQSFLPVVGVECEYPESWLDEL